MVVERPRPTLMLSVCKVSGEAASWAGEYAQCKRIPTAMQTSQVARVPSYKMGRCLERGWGPQLNCSLTGRVGSGFEGFVLRVDYLGTPNTCMECAPRGIRIGVFVQSWRSTDSGPYVEG